MNQPHESTRHAELTAVVQAGRVVLPTQTLQEDWRRVILAIQEARFDSARDRALHHAEGWADALLGALVIADPTYVALIACAEDAYARAKECRPGEQA